MPRDGDKCIICYAKVVAGKIKHLKGCPEHKETK